MKFESCSFNVVFPEIVNIREKIFGLEKKLVGFGRPFNLISVPMDAPGDMPRIVANTPNGHSTLVISCRNAQINTKFDDNFSSDIEKCYSYMKEKFSAVLDVFGNMTDEKFYYFGVTTNINLESDNPTDFINKNCIRVGDNVGKPYDISSRSTYVQGSYYINLEIRNERRFIGVAEKNNNSLYGLTETANDLVAVLDVNNRYGFNSQAGYFAKKEDIDLIMGISKEWIEQRVRLIH